MNQVNKNKFASGASQNVLGGILAGGLSRRMGGRDKCLMKLDGERLIDRAVRRFKMQLDNVVINANGEPDRFAPNELPVVSDIVEGYAGPLAGIHALMEYSKAHHPNTSHIATIAADTPFFPMDFVAKCVKLMDEPQKQNPTIVLAKSGDFTHPVFGLWPIAISAELFKFLNHAATKKVMVFVEMYRHDFVEFDNVVNSGLEYDPFFNINRAEDLEQATKISGIN